MRTLYRTSLVMALALTTAARLLGQSGSPPPGVPYLFVLDLAGTALDEFPSAVKALNGTMTVVDRDGQHMLRASSPSELLITLPQVLPAVFTVEVDLIPKSCCNPEDLMLEGTPARNRGVASAELTWHSTHIMAVGGGGEMYQSDMPADLAAATPGTLTHVVVAVAGTTVKLYTNGRRLYTLDKQFARGRVLRVWLGGQDEGLNAVYLAGLRIAAGAPLPGVVAAGVPTPTSAPAPTPAPALALSQPAPAPAPAPTPVTAVPAQATGTITPMTAPPPAPTPTPVTAVPAQATGTITPMPAPAPAPTPMPPAPTGPGSRVAPTLMPSSSGPGDPTAPVLVGTGISDITGPIAEVGMMGYGESAQQTAGLHMRLFARAFVFANSTTGKRVAWVSNELAMLFSSVKQGVLKKLNALYPGRYTDQNVMLSATHTHSGPGGYSHHVMYNLTTYGHIAQNYATIVDGITEAIARADSNLAPGTVSMMSGEVAESTMVNRSTVAYWRNPEVRGQPAPADTASINREMTVLKILRSGNPVGTIAWHAVHNTSMPKTNHLVSSDHKGYAALLFERKFGSIPPLQNYGAFVAAFPNGAEGDMSPNLNTSAGTVFTGPGRDEFESTYLIGQREFDAAYSLFNVAGQTPVLGAVDYRHMFVMMPGYPVTATKFTNGAGLRFLCPAGYGVSFNAGAEDGPAGPATEGLELGNTIDQAGLNAFRAALVATVSALLPPLGPVVGGAMVASSDPCQLPKPVLMPTGSLTNWTPTILPFQLLRVGPLAIAGVPGEMTMQAGRRLRDSLMVVLAPLGVQRVVITGLANEYSGYVTTPEEYDSQQYEGASTLYGRLTFDAYQQVFRQLGSALVTGQAVIGGPPPPDLSLIPQLELQTGVIADELLPGELPGSVLTQPPATVMRGSVVHVIYRSGHPKNDLRRNNTYFRIERDLGGGNWALVAWDAMPETKLFWGRTPGGVATGTTCGGCSSIGILWTVPTNATPGTYRIRFVGGWKGSVTATPVRYQGTTNTFVVQ